MAAHQLDDQLLGRDIAQLVAGPDVDMDNPLHADLRNALDGSAFTVLAQQHAEHRRLRRVDTVPLG
ncbi:hypothetical protein D3C76_1829550 [compost metagenome]